MEEKTTQPHELYSPSFMKRPTKDGSYNREGCSEIFCYTPQLCDCAEKTSTHKSFFLPFIEVNKELFRQGFDQTNLVSSDPEKKSYARNLLQNITKMMCEENKARIRQNLQNVVGKHFPSYRVYTVCGDKLNDFSNSRLTID